MTRQTPRAVAAAVLAQPSACAEAARLARLTDRSTTAVRDELRRCLRQMATGRRPRWTELFGRILRWCVIGRWQVHSTEAERQAVRRLAASGTVVFLPGHRSHADPLFLARVVRQCGVPRPTWFAGDNLRLPLLTGPARRAGVVFLRRRLSGDEVYRTALRLYLAYLFAQGDPLEWYQEGSRTRTGLPQPPRHGLLTHALEAVRLGTGRQVWFVPVSLTHTPVPDAARLADEEDGRRKTPESLRWFLHYVRQQRRAAGHVHVRFGTPLEAGAYAWAPQGEVTRGARLLGRDVARAVCRATAVTAEAVTAVVLTGRSPALTVPDVHRRVQPLLDALERCTAAAPPPSELRTEAGVRTALERLAAAGAATFTGADGQLVVRPVPRIATLHRNQGVHWFWPRAIAEIAALRASRVPAHGAWERGVRELRLLLDLVTCGTGLQCDPFLLATAVVELKRLTIGGGPDDERLWTFDKRLSGSGPLIAPDVLHGLITAQAVVFRQLRLHSGGRPVDRTTVLTAALSETGWSGRMHPAVPDVASPHLYSAILLDAQRRGLLDAGRAQPGLRRERAAHLYAALDDLRTLTELANRAEGGEARP
ncbi:1-acyl-sn-glycerol-3-phosphate acyltransferase [Streptomyces eurythermus]|uniref:1-acyl-sn-glycerol-3-phosphate acyltransferase n=1 Tax=Streptomyces eurythermus TaxID=42237 RepID=UPI0036D34CA0